MIRVALDMEKLSNLNSGLGQYCLNLGKALLDSAQQRIEPCFYLPKNLRNLFHQEVQVLEQKKFHKLWMPSFSNIQLWHCTHQLSKYIPSKKPYILTIHDLNFLEKYSNSIRLKMKLSELQSKVDGASGITFISSYTEKVCREYLKFPPVPARVIYNGNNISSQGMAQKPEWPIEGEFIFTIGIVEAKKNFHVLLPLLEMNRHLTLIIAGNTKNGYASDIRNAAVSKGVGNRLLMPGVINEAEKNWLYQNCKAFVFPSKAEGFGLPVIEAMTYGKPVFLADLCSLPEVGGKEAFYWESFEPETMNKVFTRGLNEYSSDPEKQTRIQKHAALFSWTKAAEEYCSFYKEVYASLS